MIEVREASLTQNIDNMMALMQENWEETGFDFPFNPHVDRFKALEAAGLLIAIGAFDGDKVVGYSLASVGPHDFNPLTIMCTSVALFVPKRLRKSTVGARLMLVTERVARERGATRMLWHTRADTRLGESLSKRGYVNCDVVMMKGL